MPAGTMVELVTTGYTIDTTKQLMMVPAYQKVYVINGTVKGIADFTNIKITTTDINPDPVTKIAPLRGTELLGGTSGAKMIVDYITASDGAATIYGKRTTTATFTGETVTGTNASGTITAVSFTCAGAETAGPHWYAYNVYPTVGSVSYGSMPTEAYLACQYRGRIVISGDVTNPHQWYMSRQAGPYDYAFFANDAQSPVAGNNADAGLIGDIITALIPYKDDYLIFGCADSIWIMRGDPAAGGSLDSLDQTTGIYGPWSFCWDGSDNLYFWGSGGFYKIPAGFKGVENLSSVNLPSLIQDTAADPSTHRITMAHDRDRHGILVMITTLADGTNKNYWFDLRTKGFFPESYPVLNAAYSSVYYDANDPDYKGLLIGCQDGYIRLFDEDEEDDDAGTGGTAINSYVTLGPIKIARDDDSRGRLQSFTAVLGTDDTDDMDYYINVADTAEEIIDNINTSPPTPASYLFSGTIPAGGGRVQKHRTRARGTYFTITLANPDNDETWAFEKIIGNTVEAGGI